MTMKLFSRFPVVCCALMTGANLHAEPVPLAPVFSAASYEHMEKALSALAMTPRDAAFEKDHGEPMWALSWVTNTLNDPVKLTDVADRIHQAASDESGGAIWSLSGELLELRPASARRVRAIKNTGRVWPDTLSKGLTDLLDAALPDIFADAVHFNEAFVMFDGSGFGSSQMVYLAASALASTFNTELNHTSRAALIEAGIAREYQMRVEAEGDLLDGTETARTWLRDFEKADISIVRNVAERLHDRLKQLRRELERQAEWPSEAVTVSTPFGKVIVGSVKSDVFDGEALLILDPGGDDLYRNGAGSANGLSGQRIALMIDLGGNDRYASEGLLASGSALFGVSILLDASGDDVHDNEFMGAASAVFGAAWVEDYSGDDIYRAKAVCQGAGMAGMGVLVDHGGNDHYQAGYYGQGFSGVKGWGMLLDRSGNDVYVAGNVRTDSDRHEDRYLSLSQGFSIGARPHAGGGVAALVDLAGNDSYVADIYGQGVSYYYAAGFLLDANGNDRYAVHQYGQGCGIHFSLGLLADANGNDMYTGFVLTQGAAHDYSVGMLFDHDGNDTYTADHHAQGRALNNAFALLVDRTGDDGYFGRQREGAQGIGNEGGFRDYGSLALLLDLAGRDIYSGGFSNSLITLRPLYGAVYDFEDKEERE